MAIEWKTVNPDFSDSAASMGHALTGYSQAGTIFGKMRESILEEEQRAADNAHRQKMFDESVRQFGLEHALDQDTLAEEKRQFGLGHELALRQQAEAERRNKQDEAIRRAGQALQRDTFNLSRQRYADEQAVREATKKAMEQLKTLPIELTAQIENKQFELKALIDKRDEELSRYDPNTLRKGYIPPSVVGLNQEIRQHEQSISALMKQLDALPGNATETDLHIRNLVAEATGVVLPSTVYTDAAKLEQDVTTARAKAVQDAAKKADERKEKRQDESFTKGLEVIRGKDWDDDEDKNKAEGAFMALMDIPEIRQNYSGTELAAAILEHTYVDWFGLGNLAVKFNDLSPIIKTLEDIKNQSMFTNK